MLIATLVVLTARRVRRIIAARTIDSSPAGPPRSAVYVVAGARR